MLLDLVDGIPDGVMKVINFVAVPLTWAIASLIFWKMITPVSPNNQSADLKIVGDQSDRSILWGSPPHDFGGEVAESLALMADLAEPTASDVEGDIPSLRELAAVASERPSISVLRLMVAPTDESNGAPADIIFSLRADCVRPDQYHVSTAAWNEEREVYEMDEWIEKSGKLYINYGMWGDFTGSDIAVDRKDVDAGLWPEVILNELQEDKIASKSQINLEGKDYLLIEMKPQQEPDAEPEANVYSKTTLWVEAGQLLLKKVATEYSADDAPQLTQIASFSTYQATPRIKKPEWMNTDAQNVIVSTEVCVVEHW